MKLLGITGGIGMGKSTAADILQRMSLPVIDTDDLARELVQPGLPALNQIVQTFGEKYLDPDGKLNRSLLALQVFSDSASRTSLEDILHPRIEEGWRRAAEEWKGRGMAVGCVVIPLLFEKSYEMAFDATICMACTATEQKRRLVARGWRNEEIQSRLEAQWPVERKISLSRFVVWTEGSPDIQVPQWSRILASL